MRSFSLITELFLSLTFVCIVLIFEVKVNLVSIIYRDYLALFSPATSPEECSLAIILDRVSTLTTKWFHLGLALGLSYNTLSVIEFDHPGDSRMCLQQMLIAWLKKKDMEVGSQPSWRALASALSSPLVRRDEIATMIAAMTHPSMALH